MPRKPSAPKKSAKAKAAPKKSKSKKKVVRLKSADGSVVVKPLPPRVRRRRSRGKSQPRAMIERWLDRMGVDHSERMVWLTRCACMC